MLPFFFFLRFYLEILNRDENANSSKQSLSILDHTEINLNRPDEIHSHGPSNVSWRYIYKKGLFSFNILKFYLVEFRTSKAMALNPKNKRIGPIGQQASFVSLTHRSNHHICQWINRCSLYNFSRVRFKENATLCYKL